MAFFVKIPLKTQKRAKKYKKGIKTAQKSQKSANGSPPPVYSAAQSTAFREKLAIGICPHRPFFQIIISFGAQKCEVPNSDNLALISAKYSERKVVEALRLG